MPECVRCHDFDDNCADCAYDYSEEYLDQFATTEQCEFVIVHDSNDNIRVIMTVNGKFFKRGTERSWSDGITRRQYIPDEIALPAKYKYNGNGAHWPPNKYLEAYPNIRHLVHERLQYVPDNLLGGFHRIRNFQ